LWNLLRFSINAGGDADTVFIIDGIDKLPLQVRSSFVDNFLRMEKRLGTGDTRTRVLISSATNDDIMSALAHYPIIDREKERRGMKLSIIVMVYSLIVSRVLKNVVFSRMERTRKSCGRCQRRREVAIFPHGIHAVE
jgi:hypothetical protein